MQKRRLWLTSLSALTLSRIINDLHNEGELNWISRNSGAFSFCSTVCNEQEIWNREKKRNIPAHVQPNAHPVFAAARCQSPQAIFLKHKWKCVFLHLQMFTRWFKSRNGKRMFFVKHLNGFLSKKVCCWSCRNVQISLFRAI